MCAVSMVGDYYRDKWQPFLPQIPAPLQPMPWPPQTYPLLPQISRAEFDELKRDVQEMKELLKRAKEYDERTGQARCEQDEKLAVLRKVAELVGVSLDDVLLPKPAGP